MSLKFAKNPGPKMTVSSISPIKEKKKKKKKEKKKKKPKNAKEQKNLQQKEVAMFFFYALKPGVGKIYKGILCWAGSSKPEFLKGWL